MNYIIYTNENECDSLISQINNCIGLPSEDGLTITWMNSPSTICLFDLETGNKTNIGYGVVINEESIDCLTSTQKDEIIILEGNINLCSWIPIIISGTT